MRTVAFLPWFYCLFKRNLSMATVQYDKLCIVYPYNAQITDVKMFINKFRRPSHRRLGITYVLFFFLFLSNLWNRCFLLSFYFFNAFFNVMAIFDVIFLSPSRFASFKFLVSSTQRKFWSIDRIFDSVIAVDNVINQLMKRKMNKKKFGGLYLCCEWLLPCVLFPWSACNLRKYLGP